MAEPPRLPDWLVAEVAGWPQDAFGAHQTRLLLRDGTVIAPVEILPSGDIVDSDASISSGLRSSHDARCLVHAWNVAIRGRWLMLSSS